MHPFSWITLVCLSVSVYGLTVTPMENGVLVKRNIPVRITLAEWKVVLTMDDPSLNMVTVLTQEIHAFRRMIQTIPARYAQIAHKQHWIREVDRVERWIKTLSPRRHRRALLNIIGDISHDLFGTATEKEVQALGEKIQENRDSIKQIIHYEHEMLSFVNVSQKEMLKNRHAINDIISTTKTFEKHIRVLVSESEKDIHALIAYNVISEKMTLIWRHVHTLQRIRDEESVWRHSLEEGRLDEYLMPVQTLSEILEAHDIDGAELIQPLEWYYMYSRVTPMWGEDFLAYIVFLPLVEGRQYEGFQIETFPVPLPNSTSTTVTLQAEGFVALSSKGQTLRLKKCAGTDPKVCDPAPVRKDEPSAYSCAQAVITSSDLKRCPAMIQSHPEGLLYQEVPNHIIIVTWSEDVMEQCPNERIATASLTAGTYQIEWSGECFITTAKWTIAGVVTRDVREKITAGWEAWDIIKFNLPKIIQNLNATFNWPSLLPNPKTIDLQLPHIIGTDLAPYFSYHYLWLIIVIVVVAIIVIVLVYYYKKCKPQGAKDTASNENTDEDTQNRFVLSVTQETE